jgi:hypothetical protein
LTKNSYFLSFFIFCLVSKYFPILLLTIIAIRNVWRIIIWKDLNWKMCKKDPYNCGKGPIYTVNRFRPENNRFLIDCNVQSTFVMLQLLWNICINELIYTTKNINIMLTEHSITHLLKLPALSFPRVIIISPFFKTIYSKVAVHLKNARSIKLWPLIIFFSFDIRDFYYGPST